MFATHYHILIDEFRHFEDISYYHMASKVDEKKERVIHG